VSGLREETNVLRLCGVSRPFSTQLLLLIASAESQCIPSNKPLFLPLTTRTGSRTLTPYYCSSKQLPAPDRREESCGGASADATNATNAVDMNGRNNVFPLSVNNWTLPHTWKHPVTAPRQHPLALAYPQRTKRHQHRNCARRSPVRVNIGEFAIQYPVSSTPHPSALI